MEMSKPMPTNLTATLLLLEDEDDHADLLRRYLESIKGWEFKLFRCRNTGEARRALADHQDIDVMILDHHLGLESGLNFLREVRDAGKHPPVIVLTGRGDEYLAVEMIQAGADDYVIKNDVSTPRFWSALKQAIEKGRDLRETNRDNAAEAHNLSLLTRREKEVLKLIVRGMTSKEISKHLCRSQHTIKIHRNNIMRKMKSHTTANLIRIVLSNEANRGLLDDPSPENLIQLA
jgi:FixJ family two-component response regulator